MMEKRAPSMMDTESLFSHQSTFDKMAEHVKEAHRGGDVSTKVKDDVKPEAAATPYKLHDFGFMDKGKK